MLTFGLALFGYGAGNSFVYMGEIIGQYLTKSRKMLLIVVFGLIAGFIVTFAEPDLQVLAEQTFQASGGMMSRFLLMAMVSVGVGIFVAGALMRIHVGVSLKKILVVSYAIVFLLAIAVSFVSPDFFGVSFDSGGVTTGPMTVPFIMALGIGAASVRATKSAQSDSFGLIALASVGPILTVLILALLIGKVPDDALAAAAAAHGAQSDGMWQAMLRHLATESGNVLIAFAPTIVIFIVMQLAFLRIPKKQVKKIVMGGLYSYIGLVLLLAGVNFGFSPAARSIGKLLVSGGSNWVLIPVGLVLGLAVVTAEPAVHVLVREVEEVSSGYIKRRLLLGSLCISVSIAVGLAMIRVLTGINLWWFIAPGYIISLLLMRTTATLFTAIAFDSGGVATGPMTVTFNLALATGASEQLGGNVLADAFGLVALVAMMPMIILQVLGYLYKRQEQKVLRLEREQAAAEDRDLEEECGDATEPPDLVAAQFSAQSSEVPAQTIK